MYRSPADATEEECDRSIGTAFWQAASLRQTPRKESFAPGGILSAKSGRMIRGWLTRVTPAAHRADPPSLGTGAAEPGKPSGHTL